MLEIILDDRETCNLSTVNVTAFIKEDNTLDEEALLEAQRLSARLGYRMTQPELELHEWNLAQKRDRLIGTSLTGWQDMVNAVGLTKEQEAKLLAKLREASHEGANELADELGGNRPLMHTTCKPEGCMTKNHVRCTDQGIFFIDELENGILDEEREEGFKDLDSLYTTQGNKITKTYKNNKKPLIKVTLENKREIKLTPSHPLSIDGQWVEAKDLKKGDILDYQLGNYTNTNEVKLKSIPGVQAPTEMSEELAWLIGSYWANGCFTTNHRIEFFSAEYEVHKEVQRIWKKLFNFDTEIIKDNTKEMYEQTFHSKDIRDWFELNNINKYDEDDRMLIPLAVRSSSKNSILAFITGYADNDGNYSINSFSITSARENFIRHLQEIGEAVGFAFGVSINQAKYRQDSFSKKDMFSVYAHRYFSTPEALEYVDTHSIKAKAQGNKRVLPSEKQKSAHPYRIVKIEEIKPEYTYDIEVEDTHWYYQGGLKSHNTLSQLPTVSSGLHFSHSPYYIRRVRISANDPLLEVCRELEYPIFPEVGQDEETASTFVIEFPVKAPQGRTKYDVSAIEQLEIYKMFMENYVDHNASITVSVRDEEWDDVEDWVFKNWDTCIGISFLSLDDNVYALAPYESITEEEYNNRVKQMKPFNHTLLNKYEDGDDHELDGSAECEDGACPVR